MMVTLPGQSEPIASQTADGFSFIACSWAETTGVAKDAVNPAKVPILVYAGNTNEATLVDKCVAGTLSC